MPVAAPTYRHVPLSGGEWHESCIAQRYISGSVRCPCSRLSHQTANQAAAYPAKSTLPVSARQHQVQMAVTPRRQAPRGELGKFVPYIAGGFAAGLLLGYIFLGTLHAVRARLSRLRKALRQVTGAVYLRSSQSLSLADHDQPHTQRARWRHHEHVAGCRCVCLQPA